MRGFTRVRGEQGFHGDGRADGGSANGNKGGSGGKENRSRGLPPEVVAAVHGLDLGRRLKVAAQEAGLTARDLAVAFGYRSDSTIRLWWREETSPSPRDLLVYARLTGKPVEYFLGQPPLVERVLQVLKSLMEGHGVAEAIETVGGERLDVPHEARVLMEAGAKEARAALTRLAGGSWASLSEADRLALVERLMGGDSEALGEEGPEPAP